MGYLDFCVYGFFGVGNWCRLGVDIDLSYLGWDCRVGACFALADVCVGDTEVYVG